MERGISAVGLPRKWEERDNLRALEERGENAPPHGHHPESVGPIEVPIAQLCKHHVLVTVSSDHFFDIKRCVNNVLILCTSFVMYFMNIVMIIIALLLCNSLLI